MDISGKQNNKAIPTKLNEIHIKKLITKLNNNNLDSE